MAEGLIANIFEIWETVLAVLLLLTVATGIFFVHSPNLIYAKTLNNEISYIASIKGDKNYQIALETDIPNIISIENNQNQNKVTVTVLDKSTTKSYIGTNIEITKENDKILIS